MELSSIAKPYANAILASCVNNETTTAWLQMLNVTTQIISNVAMVAFVQTPKIDKLAKTTTMINLINQVLGKNILVEQSRFIELLVQNNRLEILPSIASLFDTLTQNKADSKVFNILSAYALSDNEIKSLSDYLQSDSQGKKVMIKSKVDKHLLSGIVIKDGDKVTDISTKTKLESLKAFLLAK